MMKSRPVKLWEIKSGGSSKKIRAGSNPIEGGYRLRSGDSLITGRGDRLVHFSECPEGMEFAALWHKYSGTPLGKSLQHWISEEVPDEF